MIEKHADWVEEFLPQYPEITKDTIDGILKKEVGLIFERVLEDAGVYKCGGEGRDCLLYTSFPFAGLLVKASSFMIRGSKKGKEETEDVYKRQFQVSMIEWGE